MLTRTLRIRSCAVPCRLLLAPTASLPAHMVSLRMYATPSQSNAKKSPPRAAAASPDKPASEEIAKILATTPDDDDNYTPDVAAIRSVLSDVSDPTKLESKHVNLIYTIPEKETRTLFPEGFPGSRPNRPALDERGKPMYPQVEEAKFLMPKDMLFCDRQIIVREATLKLINDIASLKADQAKFAASKGFILGGYPGVGKSFTLAHVIHHCRAQDWLVVSIPRANDWMQRSPEWFPAKGLKGFYDQRDVAENLLSTTKTANEKKLAQIPVREPESLRLLSHQPETPTPTLLDLINFGLSEEEHSVNAALQFRDELQHITEFPVLLAIDEYNALFSETHYGDKYGRLLPEQMRMVAKWREFNGDKFKNGLIVAAVDETLPLSNKLQYRKVFKGDVRMVREFSSSEMRTFCLSMSQTGQLMMPVDDDLVTFVQMMSGGRPREAGKVALTGVYF